MIPNPHRTIYIEVLAPSKPTAGAPCTGCGICCLAEPCPLGMVLSGRRHGACDALRWDAGVSVYRCGVLVEPLQVARTSLPAALQWLAPGAAALLARMGRRWIAAGIGCDSTLELASQTITPLPSADGSPLAPVDL